MFLKIRKKAGNLVKPKIIELAYKILMRPVRYAKGRRLFGVEELKLVHQALLSQNLFGIDGRMVPAFEKEFARSYDVPYAVASTSGTAAIHTALGALDLNPGDEVITAPITDVGTIIPILYQQAVPVFADVDAAYNMDPQDVERRITDKTKAIVAVHLFGNPCDTDALVRIARKYKLPLIEDCSQAHLTEYKGRYAGTIGDIGCFSFQQSKHMTTGDGGMTITSNKEYYERMKLFVDKGFARKGWGARAYLFLAPNYRMNELTAAVGLAQLQKVKAVVERRRELGETLTRLLAGTDGLRPAPVTEGARSSCWLYPLYLETMEAETFAKEMIKEKVWVSAGYTGKPIYLCTEALTNKRTFGASQFPFNPKVTERTYEYKEGLCPTAENVLKHLICIPMDETWTQKRVEDTAETIKRCWERLNGVKDKSSSQPISPLPNPPHKGEGATVHLPPRGGGKGGGDLRIGIVGCGQMGRWHLDAYKRNPRVQLTAFADKDYQKADGFAREVKGRSYISHREMIDREKLDGVSVCTVPSTHREIVMDLHEAGIHVLCEKPLATSVCDAEVMTTIAEHKGRLLLAAHKFRFFEEVAVAKQLLEKRLLGKIINFRLMFGGSIDMKGTWYADRKLSGGGVIMDNGPHALDLVRYLFGDVPQIYAQTSRLQDIDVEDTARLMCTLADGVKGSIDLSWSLPIPSSAYLEIYGEEGTALLDLGGISYKLKLWNDWKRVANQSDIKGAFDKQINHFVEAVGGTPPSIVTADDGLKVQELIEKAYQSAESTVKL